MAASVISELARSGFAAAGPAINNDTRAGSIGFITANCGPRFQAPSIPIVSILLTPVLDV